MSQNEGYNQKLPFLSFHSRGERDMDEKSMQINMNFYQDSGWQPEKEENEGEK